LSAPFLGEKDRESGEKKMLRKRKTRGQRRKNFVGREAIGEKV